MPHNPSNKPACPPDASKGMSLVDLLVGIFILTITATAYLSILLTAIFFIDTSKEQSIAVNDLRNIMESIRATPFSDMPAKYPDGVLDGPASNRYAVLAGGYLLRNEHITVTYANPSSDTMEVKAALAWESKYGRAMSACMSTFKTR